MQIKITYGNAGSGKTECLIKLVKELSQNKLKTFIILAPTHNAVNNIFNRLDNNLCYEKYLKTVHSYFRIDYKNNNKMLGPTQLYKHIIIDEFSLIHKTIFKNIINLLSEYPEITLYLFGDPLQLNAVYDNDLENMISFKVLIDYYNKYGNISPYVVKHIHQSIFFNSIKNLNLKISYNYLNINYRSNDNIMKIINNLMDNNTDFDYEILSTNSVINKLKNDNNTYFLASNYKILQTIYDKLSSNIINIINIEQPGEDFSGFKYLHLSENCLLRCLETSANYYNGQVIKFKSIIGKILYGIDVETGLEVLIKQDENKRYPVGPYNILSIHKSQGYTLKNVIVCYDDIFEVSMMYTAITRASNSLSFYTVNTYNVQNLLNSIHNKDLKQLQNIEANEV